MAKLTIEVGVEVFVVCGVYIYSGKFESFDHEHLVLTEPKIVYETGTWSALTKAKKQAAWKNAEALPTKRLPIDRGAIESGPAVIGL